MNDIEKRTENFHAVVERAIQAIDEVAPSFAEVGESERFSSIAELMRAGEPRLAVEILAENLFDYQMVISHNLHDALKAVLQGAENVYDENGNFLRFDTAESHLEMLFLVTTDALPSSRIGD